MSIAFLLDDESSFNTIVIHIILGEKIILIFIYLFIKKKKNQAQYTVEKFFGDTAVLS